LTACKLAEAIDFYYSSHKVIRNIAQDFCESARNEWRRTLYAR